MTIDHRVFFAKWEQHYTETLAQHRQARVIDTWLANHHDGCCCDGTEERYDVALGAVCALLNAGYTIEPTAELIDKMWQAKKDQA
jgi:hypothetical protein